MGAFLVGGVRLGFFRRDPGRETVVTGLAADRLFEDESVKEVPRFGGRRVDPVGFAPGADQNSPREKRHYPLPPLNIRIYINASYRLYPRRRLSQGPGTDLTLTRRPGAGEGDKNSE